MTSLLDFEVLTAPISGDRPAGATLPMDVLTKMKNARKESEPHPEDPSQPDVPKKADWAGIIKLASDCLAKTSKDLLAATRLVEALAKRDGFAGLRDGLTLLRRMVVECWDRMHPLVEEPDDLDARVGPFQWLSDPEGGAWFPGTIRSIPLVKIGGQAANLLECQAGRTGDQAIEADALRIAQPVTATVIAEVAACLEELTALDAALTEKMGDRTPSLFGLVDAVTECQKLLDRLAVSPPVDVQSPESADTDAPMEPAGVQTAAGRSNRADVYRQLARLADELDRLEPHSPIPDLLRWAVTLGGMPFRQLIQELVREPAVLADIRRQLGIKEVAESAASE